MNGALLGLGALPFRLGRSAAGRATLAYKTAKVERQARRIEEAALKKAEQEEAKRRAREDADPKSRAAEASLPPRASERPLLREEDLLRNLNGDSRKRPAPEREKKPKPRPPVKSASGYVLPPIALLEEDNSPPIAIDREEVLDNGRTLVRALKDFGIEGQLGQAHPGPVITQYEYEPAAGVKISQIVSRAEDLALALKASRVRLVAPIPGKAAVGVEVPNRAAATINFRTILSEVDLLGAPGELPLVLGRDIRGRAQLARLDAMPHLLVAGTTGSGKSVCLNVLLLSLLYRRTPEELRLLLIDPKMLELTPYDGIPHLLCPVVTEAKMAAKMLGWLVTEMERRYRRMASFGVRNLSGYNAKLAVAKPDDGMEPMPYIVVIVDELADLMMTVANEVEGPIARLAQMARAVGIHLILATQRPSVDVLTGVIKANFPARIAFQVASKVDSRTILDANGAESLLGRGDMLFLPPGKAEATRVHGAFVSDRDTEAVVNFLKQQPPAPEIFREELLSRDADEAGFDDELFEDALRLVVTQRMASTSFLQRRLKVGYSRAGRLMDLLQQAGAVGAQDGSKAREVLADERFLDEWLKKEKLRATGVEP
ncbi:MAG: DNA translocase FtsK [Candidatus Eisenbacteria bacterium]